MKLPKGWHLTELGDLLTQKPEYGVNAPSVPYVEQDTPRLLRITDIDSFGRILDRPRVGVPLEMGSGCEVSEGDLLIARTGATVGKSTLVSKLSYPAVFAGYLIRFKPDDVKIDRMYLRQFLGSPRYWKWVSTTIRAGAQPNINSQEYCSLLVPQPPLPEQRKIADILTTWDEALEKLEALIEAKERRKKALMQQLLSGKSRLKGFVKPWKPVRLGSLLVSADRYEKWDEGRIARLAGVRRNGGGLFFRAELPASEIKVKTAKIIREGDFLISRRQITYGGMAIVPRQFDGFEVNDEYEVLVARSATTLDIRYFGFLAHTRRLKHLAYLASNGFFAERLRLNFDLPAFLDSRVYFPTEVGEQHQIAAVLDTADKQLTLLHSQRTAIDQQKRGLMQRLLTGKIRVKTA